MPHCCCDIAATAFTFVPLAYVVLLICVPLTIFSIYEATKIRKVTSNAVICPFCEFNNELVEQPDSDINCRTCNRMIPITDGKILAVDQVRCSFLQRAELLQ